MRKRPSAERRVTLADFRSELAARAGRAHLPRKDGAQRPAEDLTEMYERTDPARRKKLGQFFTPPRIAEFMVKFGIDEDTKTAMDPACGLGAFLRAGARDGIKFYGIDVDDVMVEACRYMARGRSVELRRGDYLRDELPGIPKVDFLVCNPPYLNFHDFDRELVSAIEKKHGVRFSRLANLYALFMVKAAESVKKGGKMAFITPSEFMYTGYGKALKKFMLENFTLVSFVTFDEAVFETALTTSTISLLVNEKAPEGHRVAFVKTGGRLAGPDGAGGGPGVRVNRVRQDMLDPGSRWHKHHSAKLPAFAKNLVPLARQAAVKRGIATGSNAFFTLSEAEARRWRIEDFLVPVISRASQMQGYRITKAALDRLGREGQKVHLLYCTGAPSRDLRKYIEHGENAGVHERYLCAHRSPWYRVEARSPAPILATVFSRDNMRFVRNDARCLNLAAYHGVYPRFSGRDAVDAFLCYLNSGLCAKMQEVARREYGGGLHKFEPGDLLDLPVLPVTELGGSAVAELASAFRRVSAEPDDRPARREADDKVREIAASLPAPGPE